MNELNPPQKAAVTTLAGPLLVLAGAGTGKTRVITFRIAQLIRHGVTPHRILAMTFTNKAAREMRERALHLLGKRKKGATVPEISTFHSLCVRVLRRHHAVLGYPREFSIYDRGDQESLARAALRDIRVGHETLRPGDLLHQIGQWKTLGVRPGAAEELATSDKQLYAAAAYVRYQAQLKASGAMDFDDLLLLTDQLFRESPEVRFAEATRFDHVLVDEYQDTNALQYAILRALADRHRNLCVVGDDDQSIYAWRGAEVTHILGFAKDWPEAKVVKLEDNYRCREPILELANRLIAHNTTRHKKVLRAYRSGGEAPRFVRLDDETKEAEAVVRDIHAKIAATEGGERLTPADFAILLRTNEQPRAFELELRRQRIPYILVGGQSFYDRKEVRDVLSYLRVFANPNDEVSLLRVINTPARGIGTSSVEGLLKGAVERGVPLWGVLADPAARSGLSEGVGPRIDGFRRLIEGFRARLGESRLSELVRELVTHIEYKKELERLYKTASDVDARWNGVEELINAVAQYEASDGSPSLLGFLETTTLDARDDPTDEDKRREKKAVTLMTLHSAKGLEFPYVYLVGMEEGLLPHKRSVVAGGQGIEEERRLCYVGVTRAREQLTLTLCKERMKWGKLRPSLPSRFLMEMRGESERALKIAEASAKEFGSAEAGGAGRVERAPDKKKPAARRAKQPGEAKQPRQPSAKAPKAAGALTPKAVRKR